MTRGMIRLVATQTEVPQARSNAASPALAFADSDPPLWDGLGSLAYKVTTASSAAQSYFDQGLRLTHAFNHEEAQRAFRKAQKLDPDCAMCFWGEALVLGPNINMPMVEEAVAPAFAAAQKARALAAKAAPHEQALIAALATRYAENPKADRAELDAAYAAAMAKAAAQFPEDNEITVLYAEALMDLSPWNYWQPGGREPNPQSAEIVPTLERVLAKDPNHPGAIHYYIHAVEASDRPGRAEPYADRLRGAVPGAGHLVHMPSHIYYRVGRYLDALADNTTAAAVDEKYLAASDAPMGVYRLLPAQCAFRHGVGVDGRRWTKQHRRGGQAARPHPRRGGARHSGRAAREGGTLLRPCPVQLARRHPRPPRPGQLDSLREGDVALRPRRGLRGATRFPCRQG
jgi:tetratricopeptide (TPR) repeat protein